MPTKIPLIIGIFIFFLLAGAFLLIQRNQTSLKNLPYTPAQIYENVE